MKKLKSTGFFSVLRRGRLALKVGGTIISEEDRKLIGATRKLMDELIETLDVVSSPEELDAIKESLEQIREGRVTSWDVYKRDLKAKGKL